MRLEVIKAFVKFPIQEHSNENCFWYTFVDEI